MNSGTVPMKYQIYDYIKDSIIGGRFKPDELIPSEMELCKKFSVSRTTISAALQMLQNDSFIYRKQGKGSFVSKPKFSRDLSSSKTRFFGMMESNKDIHPTTQILQIRTELTDSTVAQKLDIKANEKIVFLKRLRLIDDVPVAITWSYMLWKYGCKLLQMPLEPNFSIITFMRNEYRQEPTSGTIKLTVQDIFGPDAKILDVEEGFTCCKTESVSFIGNEKFELAHTLMRADKFEFIIKRIDY